MNMEKSQQEQTPDLKGRVSPEAEQNLEKVEAGRAAQEVMEEIKNEVVEKINDAEEYLDEVRASVDLYADKVKDFLATDVRNRGEKRLSLEEMKAVTERTLGTYKNMILDIGEHATSEMGFEDRIKKLDKQNALNSERFNELQERIHDNDGEPDENFETEEKKAA